MATGATGPKADDRPAGSVVVRPARDLAEALRAGELLRATYDQGEAASPAYLEHLRDVGPRMALAELLVAVDPADQVLGSVTYARFGTPFALVSVDGEGELRMLGVSDHRGKQHTEELLITACVERAERDGCTALAMSSVRTRTRTPGKAFQRMGFRPAKGRELSPMPGLNLDVFVLTLPRSPRGPDESRSRWRRGVP